MGLADIAAGIEVTTRQQEREVVAVDATGATLAGQLEPFAEELPCEPGAAAAVLERYVEGGSVGSAGRVAGVPPMTAAKTLHLLGESVSPLGPTGREVVRDWIDGRLSRTEAVELTRAGDAEFALAAYVETHEPIAAARAAVESVLAARRVEDARPLVDAIDDPSEFV